MKTSRWMEVVNLCLLFCFLGGGLAYGAEMLLRGFGAISTVQAFKEFGVVVSPHWQAYAEDFISFVNGVGRLYLPVIVGVPLVFLIHFVAIGPKGFEHRGRRISFYGLFTRFLHWMCAIFFSLVVVSGIMVVFAKALGGGSLVLSARGVHLFCAYGFMVFAAPLFLIWLKDMFPAPYDIKWLLCGGGYLSKKKVEVPAGKFNLGQKMWFWLAFVGGAVMFYTGYVVSGLSLPQAQIAGYIKIHLILGLFIVALFITHLYMSLFAVKGSLRSMISGYKWEEEVRVLHSRMLK